MLNSLFLHLPLTTEATRIWRIAGLFTLLLSINFMRATHVQNRTISPIVGLGVCYGFAVFLIFKIELCRILLNIN